MRERESNTRSPPDHIERRGQPDQAQRHAVREPACKSRQQYPLLHMTAADTVIPAHHCPGELSRLTPKTYRQPAPIRTQARVQTARGSGPAFGHGDPPGARTGSRIGLLPALSVGCPSQQQQQQQQPPLKTAAKGAQGTGTTIRNNKPAHLQRLLTHRGREKALHSTPFHSLPFHPILPFCG